MESESTLFTMPDEEIVALIRREPAMFGHIIDRYQAKLCRYVMRLGVRSKEDQEDVLQEIFIKVYKNLNSFDTGLSFSSWIYRIGHNEAISWYRKRNVRPEGHLIEEGEDLLHLISTREADSEVQFDERANAEAVSSALEQLDEKYRSALILRFFEHKEYEEISDILKIPVGSVGTLIHRGKQQLLKYIDPEHIRV